jgi:hypothetical protein
MRDGGNGLQRPDQQPLYLNRDCSMTAVHLYLSDHKPTTINRVIDAVKHFHDAQQTAGLQVQLARATRECWRRSTTRWCELPMML